MIKLVLGTNGKMEFYCHLKMMKMKMKMLEVMRLFMEQMIRISRWEGPGMPQAYFVSKIFILKMMYLTL